MPPTHDDYYKAALDRLKKPPKGAPYHDLPRSQRDSLAEQAAAAIEARPVALSRPWVTISQARRTLADATGAVMVLGDRLQGLAAALTLDVAQVFHVPPVAMEGPYDSVYSKANQVGQSLWSRGQILGDQCRPDEETLPAGLEFAISLAARVARRPRCDGWTPATLALETRTAAEEVGLYDDDVDRPIIDAAVAIALSTITALSAQAAAAQTQAEETDRKVSDMLDSGNLLTARACFPNHPRVIAAVAEEGLRMAATPFTAPITVSPAVGLGQGAGLHPMVQQALAAAVSVAGTEVETFLKSEGLGNHLSATEHVDRYGLAFALRGTPGVDLHCFPGAGAPLIQGTKPHVLLKLRNAIGMVVGAVIAGVRMEWRGIEGQRAIEPWADTVPVPKDEPIDGQFLMNPAARLMAAGGTAQRMSVIVVTCVQDYLAQAVLQAAAAVQKAVARGIEIDDITDDNLLEVMRPVIGVLPGSVDDPRHLQNLIPPGATVCIRGRGDEAGVAFQERLAHLLAGHARVRVLLLGLGQPIGEIEKLRSGVLLAHPAHGTKLHRPLHESGGEANFRLAIRDVLARVARDVQRLPLPWAALQGELHGLGRNVTLLCGRPGARKSDFAVDLAIHARRLGVPVLYVAAEMDTLEVQRRFLARAANVSWGKMGKGILSSAEAAKVAALQPDFSGLTIWTSERRKLDSESLAARVEVWVEETLDQLGTTSYPPLVIIDYFQKLAGGGVNPGGALSAMAYDLEESSRVIGFAVLGISAVARTWYPKLVCGGDHQKPLGAWSKPAHEFVDAAKGDGDLEFAAADVLVVGTVQAVSGEITEVKIGVAKQREGRISPPGGWITLLVDEVGLHEPVQGPSV